MPSQRGAWNIERRDDPSRGDGARSAPRRLALLVALALCGCESTQERSAELQRQANTTCCLGERGVTKERPEREGAAEQVIHERGTAVVVALRNTSTPRSSDVPIAITVKRRAGSDALQNDAPGLEPSLTPSRCCCHGQASTWVDDQVHGQRRARRAERASAKARRPRGAHPATRASPART